jgi:hypothetical protein
VSLKAQDNSKFISSPTRLPVTLTAMSAPAFVCSMCRKPIAVGGKVIKCSVSTCNSGRVRLLFCSPSCWDSHLPGARHRSAYFTEEVARREG